MIRVGLVGFGYWGPNLARVFSAHPGCRLARICEPREERRKLAELQYPGVEIAAEDRITRANDIDVVLVATPVHTHFELTRQALRHGKHVWVEKPFTATADQARELVDLAADRRLTLLVDHTFLFTSAVREIKKRVSTGELGDLYYYDSVRINLGLVQQDVNVIWDLAPHDLSIMDHLLGPRARAVSAQGRGHFGTGLEDVAYVTVMYDDDLIAHFHLNWLSPVKLRRTVLGGSDKMLVWDDLEPEEKIKIYDKGAEVTTTEGAYGAKASYRVGDMFSPALGDDEALAAEAEYFVRCLVLGQQPHNDGHAGLRIVELLEATDRSLAAKGALIEL